LKRLSRNLTLGIVILISSFYLLTTLDQFQNLAGSFIRRMAGDLVLAINQDIPTSPVIRSLQSFAAYLPSTLVGGSTDSGGKHLIPTPFSSEPNLNSPSEANANSDRLYLPLVTRFDQLVLNQHFFQETFDGNPPSPQPWNPSNWDITVHSRDMSTLYQLEPMNADHGPDCSAPPATHPISSYEDAVYQCHNHVMTAINAEGYGVIYLTPNQMVDFSNGEAVVRFDMSTRRKSDRDWVDLWVTPFQDNLQLPLDSWLPDLSGEHRNAVHFRMDFNSTSFKIEVIHNFSATEIPGDWRGYDTFLTPSATRRDTFELHISSTHLKFGMPDYNFWWVDTDIPALGWNQGVVQFGHHSYNPTKDCGNDGTCGPNTWHWDNVYINPAVPFTIIRANQRHIDPTTPPDVTLPEPAPSNAHLRFTGLGPNIEVSFNNGQTWQPAQTQNQDEYIEDHFWSYWTPIPAGVSKFQIRGQEWWGGVWMVRDLSVWSLQKPAPSN
jgi:hypothetical protein